MLNYMGKAIVWYLRLFWATVVFGVACFAVAFALLAADTEVVLRRALVSCAGGAAFLTIVLTAGIVIWNIGKGGYLLVRGIFRRQA